MAFLNISPQGGFFLPNDMLKQHPLLFIFVVCYLTGRNIGYTYLPEIYKIWNHFEADILHDYMIKIIPGHL